jgi:hypothetical protein
MKTASLRNLFYREDGGSSSLQTVDTRLHGVRALTFLAVKASYLIVLCRYAGEYIRK